MKVLFLDHPEADMLAAVLYLGLQQELGAENVLDWPYKPSYHGHSDDTYHLPDGKRGFTAPFSWMPALPGGRWEGNDVVARIGEFDLVVLASPRRDNVIALSYLINQVGRQALRRLVFVDGEDSADMRWDLVDQFQPTVCFKREMFYPLPHATARVVPCPFGSPVPELAAVQKDLDVVFLGGDNFPGGRAQIHDRLQQAFGARYEGNARLPHDQFLHLLSRAKIAIGTRGHGWDALRLWEIPSCPGTLLLRDRTPLLSPHPFENEQTCVFFDSPDHLVDLARGLISDEPRRRRIAETGNRHLREHHSARARARYLLEESFR